MYQTCRRIDICELEDVRYYHAFVVDQVFIYTLLPNSGSLSLSFEMLDMQFSPSINGKILIIVGSQLRSTILSEIH